MNTVKEDMVLETAVPFACQQLLIIYAHVMGEVQAYETDKHVKMVLLFYDTSAIYATYGLPFFAMRT